MGAILFISIPYILKFGGSGFSNSTTVWGEYGSYISGVTSILNLIAFLFLSYYVAKLANKNNEEQIEIQRKLLKAQFRQSELLKYNEELNNTFRSFSNEDLLKFIMSLINFNFTTMNLINFKGNIFPILLEKDINKMVWDYVTEIKNHTGTLNKYKNYDEYLKENDFASLSLIMATIKAKGEEIVRRLQDSVLDDFK
ncbi:MAG: YebO family protein [Prolixibacteraceae bacterium]|jgi:hypothetical protein|nr:YebO family protein [Prolixibacteraceae bacterium]